MFAGPGGTKRPLGLAAGTLREFDPVATARAAVDSGFDGVGAWVEPASWTAATTRDVRAVLADSGLAPMDVEVIWIQPGPLDPDHLRILDIGGEIGAPNALVVNSDPDHGAATAKFASLCAHAAPLTMRVSLEFALFTEVKSLDQALAIVEGAAHPAAALLVDPLHLARCGHSPADLARVPPHLFAYAQYCDAPATGPSPGDRAAIIDEALDGRVLPGEGALPLRALIDALPANLPLSVELRSKALRETFADPYERARIVADATRGFLEARP